MTTASLRDRLVLIEAPSNLGLMPPAPGLEPGTSRAPDALRDLGLHGRIGVSTVTRVEPAPYDPDDGRDVRNVGAIADFSLRLADAVESELRGRRFPLVLGGDCSILIGCMLGLGRLREPALVFIDGHSDFFLPEQSATGGAAGMDLAIVAGWGPGALTDLQGRRPYVGIGRVAALAIRDEAERPAAAIPALGQVAGFYRSLPDLRIEGVVSVAHRAVAAIDPGRGGFWIHLDIDAVDSRLMPAVDSPQPDGLDWGELEALLEVLFERGAVGLDLTIYDPDRDPDRLAGRSLVDALARVFA